MKAPQTLVTITKVTMEAQLAHQKTRRRKGQENNDFTLANWWPLFSDSIMPSNPKGNKHKQTHSKAHKRPTTADER